MLKRSSLQLVLFQRNQQDKLTSYMLVHRPLSLGNNNDLDSTNQHLSQHLVICHQAQPLNSFLDLEIYLEHLHLHLPFHLHLLHLQLHKQLRVFSQTHLLTKMNILQQIKYSNTNQFHTNQYNIQITNKIQLLNQLNLKTNQLC